MRLLSAAMTLSAAPFRHSYCSARHAPLIIDTDCGLDDLATLVFAAATATPISLVTTTSGLAPPGRGHSLARSMLDYVGLQDVRVVAGAEMPPPGVVREKAEWEMAYQQRVADVTAAMGLREAAAEAEVVDAGDAGAAADAILSAARESGGNATDPPHVCTRDLERRSDGRRAPLALFRTVPHIVREPRPARRAVRAPLCRGAGIGGGGSGGDARPTSASRPAARVGAAPPCADAACPAHRVSLRQSSPHVLHGGRLAGAAQARGGNPKLL